MKKFISLLIAIAIIFILPASNTVQASDGKSFKQTYTTIEYLDNGDCIETTLVVSDSSKGTVNGTKTSTYKNSSNETLWYVSVTGTFSYNGTSSTCINASGDSHSYSSYWTVSNPTVSKSGNTATSTATGKKRVFGIVVQTQTLTVTLSCSKNGVLS
ncbi:MAG: hypothetical protein II838_08300 [Lachnospiraceae bacterium]|jgi:hypothetical protein|nr:hypothetical protein [Lachnospiraceae bacterium]